MEPISTTKACHVLKNHSMFGELFGYQSPPGGVPVFTKANRRLIFPNEPVLVDEVVSRVPIPEVFKLLTCPLAE
jgi:hypothetical protein